MLIPAAAALPCLASPGSLTVEDDSGELCLSATVQAGMDPVDQRLACYNPDEGAERDVLDEVPRGTIPLVPTPDDPPIVPGSLDVYDQDGEFCLAATAQTYGGPMQQPLACYNPGSDTERDLLAQVPHGSIPLGAPPAP